MPIIGCTPTLHPRPDYPEPMQVLVPLVLSLLRFPAMCSLFALMTHPLYISLSKWIFSTCSDEYLSSLWFLPSWVNMDDILFTVGLSASISTVYILSNSFFFICDAKELLQQYKLPRKKSQEPSPELIARTLKEELFAHIFVGPALMLIVVGPLLRYNNPEATNIHFIPNAKFSLLWKQFFVCYVTNEILFYYGHRLLHSTFLYKAIHKQHHKYIGTRSFAAEYAHFIEDVLTAYFPFVIGSILIKAHFHIVFCWFFCKLTETYEVHSGYCFKGSFVDKLGFTHSIQAAHHDFHHTKNSGNFGNAFLDYIHGTMDLYMKYGGIEGYTNKTSNIVNKQE
eukprot:GSMAST32.ASY1.ANO1.56.1 assembled CDS